MSDVHGNARALEAVLKDAQNRGYDRVAYLGDALGYGPHPVETLELLQAQNPSMVVGNHDDWAIKLLSGTSPNHFGVAGLALVWQLQQLNSQHVAWLKQWPEQQSLVFKLPQASQTPVAIVAEVAPQKAVVKTQADNKGVPGKGGKMSFSFGAPVTMPPPLPVPVKPDPQVGLIIHGSPREKFEYTDSITAARAGFESWKGRLAFVGHTHVPGVYSTLEGPTGEWTKQQAMRDDRARLIFPPRARWIANPGSVGQPRDGNPKASYGIYDDDRHLFEVFRVEYDIAATQRDIRNAKLPEPLAVRLSIGK